MLTGSQTKRFACLTIGLLSFGLGNAKPVKALPLIARNSAPPQVDVKSLEVKIHQLINGQRQKHGLRPLKFDSQLSAIARTHSRDMARKRFFSHHNLNGLGPSERGQAAGYSCQKSYGTYYTKGLGENLYLTSLYASISSSNGAATYNWRSAEQIAANAVKGWMASPGHRQNILKSTYNNQGIGISTVSQKVYVTQNFC